MWFCRCDFWRILELKILAKKSDQMLNKGQRIYNYWCRCLIIIISSQWILLKEYVALPNQTKRQERKNGGNLIMMCSLNLYLWKGLMDDQLLVYNSSIICWETFWIYLYFQFECVYIHWPRWIFLETSWKKFTSENYWGVTGPCWKSLMFKK